MSTTPPDQITDTAVDEEMRTSFLSYAMSVVVSRALPDVRDGLKPVHRRILYGMAETGLTPSKPHVKCAKVVGHVMGSYHPHGDSAIYNSMVRMAQDFSMRVPLIDGHGNFGTQTDSAAAMRYCAVGSTRVRLADGSTPTLGDIAERAGVYEAGEAGLELKVLGARGETVAADRIFHSGEHDVLTLRTKGGLTLTGSHNHPVLTLVANPETGAPALTWKRLDELATGDYVTALRSPAAELGQPLTQTDADLALLFGSFVSEGWYTSRAGFNNTDQAWFDDVREAYARTIGTTFYTSTRALASGKPTYEIDIHNLAELDASPLSQMAGLRSADKVVPAWVWEASPLAKARFLQALFEGDGSFSLLDRSSVQVVYSTKSAQLAADVQQLLLEFGVVSNVCQDMRRPDAYRTVVSNRRDARIFAERIGFLSRKREPFQLAVATLPAASRSMSSDHVPHLAAWIRASAPAEHAFWLQRHNVDPIERWERDTEIADRLPAHVRALAEHLTDGTHYFTPVQSVEPAGTEAVYSLRIDTDEHAYVTNGLVSHNTEARMSKAALAMTDELDEDTVDFVDNYDGSTTQPSVLPAAFPNLLVNGSEGIAVGMATKMPPHNLNESIKACQHLLRHPDATLDDLMEIVTGPDLPTGGYVLGLDGIREAYRTGKGKFRMRARAAVEEVRARRNGIVVTELPYQVAPEHVIAKIKELRDVKKLQGVANIVDLSDMKSGLRLVIEVKTGFNSHAVLEELYKSTPLEESFTIHNLALVAGQPQTLTLHDLIRHYVEHRLSVTTRRCEFRRRKAEAQAHLLEGYLVALSAIDEVVKIIRGSRDTASARAKLMKQFKLSEIQTNAILEMPLRRLTSLEVSKIKNELAELRKQIAELTRLLTNDAAMRTLICDELETASATYGSPRRSALLETVPESAAATASLEIPDEPCQVTLSTTGLIGRFPVEPFKGARGRHDALVSSVTTTARATLGAVTSRGRLLFVPVIELPTADAKVRGGGVTEFVPVEAGERVLALVAMGPDAPMLALATKGGIVKRITPAEFGKRSGDPVIGVKDGDEVLAVATLPAGAPDDAELVFVTSDAQLLRTAAGTVRPQGRTGGGVAGVKLADGAHVVAFHAVATVDAPSATVVTVTDGAGVKSTPFEQYPAKGRATGGVRCMRMLKDENVIVAAHVGTAPVTLVAATGALVKVPAEQGRRDGAGARLETPIAKVAPTR